MKNPLKRKPLVKADPNVKPEKVKYTYIKGPVRKKTDGKEERS